MQLTLRDLRTIGENRYWHKVSKKLFIFLTAALGWALLCILVAYMIGMVKPTLSTFTVNSRILSTAQELSQAQDVAVTIEGNDIYVGDVRLPREETRDSTIPFMLISMGPMMAFLVYLSYHSFKAGEAGTALIEEWIKDGQTVIS